MFRVILAAIFLLASTGLIWVDLSGRAGATFGEVLGDLGTEMFGILVTIALVDWVLERRRKQDRAREVAWGVLAELQHAVWVWQGGARQQSPGDLLGLISGIKEVDEMEPFTEGLFLSVAFHAQSTLQTEPTALKSLSGLLGVFKEIEQLSSIENLKPQAKVRVATEVLSEAVAGLARVLRQPTEWMPSGLIWHVDPSREAQEKRYNQAWTIAAPVGSLGARHRG
jgi:hypothetical protein